MNNSNLDFVTRHFKRGAFSANAGWHRLGITSPIWYRRIAAAVAIVFALGATATLLYINHDASSASQSIPETNVELRHTVQFIDFDNAVLTDVVAEIENTYEIKVAGVPDDASSCRLTLHYEGNADNLIEMINNILNTNMTIE